MLLARLELAAFACLRQKKHKYEALNHCAIGALPLLNKTNNIYFNFGQKFDGEVNSAFVQSAPIIYLVRTGMLAHEHFYTQKRRAAMWRRSTRMPSRQGLARAGPFWLWLSRGLGVAGALDLDVRFFFEWRGMIEYHGTPSGGAAAIDRRGWQMS